MSLSLENLREGEHYATYIDECAFELFTPSYLLDVLFISKEVWHDAVPVLSEVFKERHDNHDN